MSEENVGTPEEVMTKAKAMGYDPDRYAQDDPKWKSPEEFVEFGERLQPVLKERTRYLEEKNASLEARIQAIQTEVVKFAKIHEETEKAAYAKALADLKAQKAEALGNQDYEAVVELDEQIADTKQAQKQPPVAAVERKPEIPAEIVQLNNEWMKANPYTVEGSAEYDLNMDAYARAMGEVIVRKEGKPQTAAEYKEFLGKVTARVKEAFPEKFENPMRHSSQTVEGDGGAGVGVGSAKRTYANLPQAAKEACDVLVATQPGYTREKYLKIYRW